MTTTDTLALQMLDLRKSFGDTVALETMMSMALLEPRR